MRRHHIYNSWLPITALWIVVGSAAAPASALTPPAVELVRPAAGSVLDGGGRAVVEWAPTAGLLETRIEEWEAFLSFNGGLDYPVRLTPHLDVDRRRFTFDVPDIPTDSARILLRFGDEKQEVSVDVPYVFSVRAAAVPVAARRGLPTPQRGEAARPGDRGVMVWTDGPRDGGRRALYRALPRSGLQPIVAPSMGEAPPPARSQDERVVPAATGSPTGTVRPETALAPTSLALPPSPIRLLSCRQNE